MRRLLPIAVLSALAFAFSTAAGGQVAPAQSIASTPAPRSSAENATPAKETSEGTADPASLLPALPPLHPAKSTLIGGTIERLDRVQDRLTVSVFGGGKVKIVFDPRTRIYRDGDPATAADLKRGDRVYIDTVLDQDKVFALNIRMKKSDSAGEGQSQGVVLSYRADRGELTMRDTISPHAFTVRLGPSTRIVDGDRPIPASELVSGTLVNVKLGAQLGAGKDGHDWAREISVLAVPGASFTFAGRVTSLDLRLGLLVLTSATDGKTYEIYFDSGVLAIDDHVRPGVDVTIVTRFEGDRYLARSLTINASTEATRSEP
jgi:hypothetical protein